MLVVQVLGAMTKEVTEQLDNSKREGGILIPFSILTDENLTSTEKHVYCYILSFNVNGLDFFSGSEATGKKLGINPVQVRKAVAHLCFMGYLTRAKSNGMSVIRCNKLIQLTDPIATNRYTTCNESLQSAQQIVTHNNNNNNNNNNKISNTQNSKDKDPTPHSEKNTPEAKTPAATPKKNQEPSPKIPAKGSPSKAPRPDADDKSLRVLMTDAEWDKFQRQVGDQCAFWWCQQFEDYAESQPKKFKAYTSHYRTLLKWHQMRCAGGELFGWTPQGGLGFYKHWVTGLKVGGRDEK